MTETTVERDQTTEETVDRRALVLGKRTLRPVEVIDGEVKLQRYRTGPRYVHLLMAVSFTVLFLTGLPLLWEPLSFLAEGGYTRIIHRVAAVGFLAVPPLYLLVDREGAKELLRDSFTYDRDDVRWLLNMGRYALGSASQMPPAGRLNAGQKLHHALVLILAAGVVGSGLTLWIVAGDLTDAQLAWSVLVHNLTAGALVLLTIGHVYFTLVYRAVDRMHTGYISKHAAELEYPKWVEEFEQANGASLDAAPGASPDEDPSAADDDEGPRA